MEQALEGAHAVDVCEEADERGVISPQRLMEMLQYPVFVDACNL